jgi:hypothetical protein
MIGLRKTKAANESSGATTIFRIDLAIPPPLGARPSESTSLPSRLKVALTGVSRGAWEQRAMIEPEGQGPMGFNAGYSVRFQR